MLSQLESDSKGTAFFYLCNSRRIFFSLSGVGFAFLLLQGCFVSVCYIGLFVGSRVALDPFG